ncbi:hypothetical protein B2G71_02815 [Novosphingobium sp. PC22D]|uniref:TauD/TfdA dioxygenase family protein n=1 Tax=Novosphingobium sp. PC22D TaxID=1962403 RepID=UPI000BFB0CB7|nr:TauD/TfdA family dioxygenase [Novosphingobium sp. PC22D]PEQ14527.1 hypothetical protein B2G71_02815 [Novosphingobium sp. PC22D]
MALETIDLTPRIASQVRIAKRDLLAGSHAGEIRDLLVARGAIVIRDLFLDDEELRTVARSLGDLRVGTARRGSDGKVLAEGDGGVLKVSLDPKVNPDYARFLFGNQLWHMDGTYLETIPPFATMLTPFALSKEGGDTQFANTYAAFEDLPRPMQRRLETLTVRHSLPAALFPAKRDCTAEEFAVWASYPTQVHPLVWQHRSGRKSLVLSTACARILELDATASHDLLLELMAHATQEQYVYSHKWRMGDLAIWDNTGTMHRVLPFEEGSAREMHRCTLNGEEPIAAVRDVEVVA